MCAESRDAPEVRVRVDCTNEEVLTTWAWKYFDSPTARAGLSKSRSKANSSLMLAMVVMLGGGIWLYWAVNSPNPPSGLAVMVGVFVVLAILGGALTQRRNLDRKRYERAWREQLHRNPAGGEHSYVLFASHEHVGWVRGGAETKYQWSLVAAIYEREGYVVLDFPTSPGVVPLRCFGSAVAAQEAVARMREWHARAGGGEEAVLVRALADTDAQCPGCGYNLRGLSRPVCPECGLAANFHTLPQLARGAA